MDNVIYLDNNATTRVDAEVFVAMQPFFCERYGNPSSIHRFGGSVAADIEKARCRVADLLGASFRDKDGIATEIIFTSCGTEGDNAAINAALNAKPERKKIVTTCVEHPGILAYCKELSRRGYEVAYAPVDGRGRLDMEFMKKEVDENTAIVTVMWANNETGTIFPVAELVGLAHEKGALFHTDAVQAAGKVQIDVDGLGIDFLSISGHKLHAPKGVGALFVRRGLRFRPLIFGGHQERSRRAGTENVTSIIGLGKACELAQTYLPVERLQLAELRDRLEKGVLERIPNVRINGDIENRLPNTASISFEYIEGESILMLLDRLNICASSGSACTTGSLEPSHVLRAMGLPYTAAHGTIRFSLSRFNTAAEIDKVIEALPPIIAQLREISPYWQERGK
ncbi:cysteine desulfurase NifS [Victivallis vadensis]|jgi:cysteine desulfurase nifS|uniref:Cysteine desulfurase n=1 Tax=Victivallis vadensis TaxID=172901 RepID=A0A848AYD8_9BACT|nr:cysteine desulfurase NifS [Victivallis vadensis]NMD87077.1 cysteine desulfurase NifS [Victivallis vadensis]PWM84672.1 MAG: cysteine desulfurase NifS [Lentisphaerota bacterium]